MLAADEDHGRIYAEEVAPNLREGAALCFAHGLSIRFGLIEPRPDLDVFLVAPKGPGTALRARFHGGLGPDLAVRGRTRMRAAARRRSPCPTPRRSAAGRVGILPTSFAEECEADLFNEQAVLWGAIPELIHRRLRDPGRSRLLAGNRLFRMPHRGEADRRPDRRARHRRDARGDLQHRRVRRAEGRPPDRHRGDAHRDAPDPRARSAPAASPAS